MQDVHLPQKEGMGSKIEIARHVEASRLNEILNDPSVRPDVADVNHGALDLTDAVGDQKNVLLVGEHGAIFFIQIGVGIYECHTQTLPKGRGRWIFSFTKACAEWMFCRTNAFEVVTRIPASHHGARYLAVMSGMTKEFSRPLATVWRGQREGVDIYGFRLQEWAAKAKGFEHSGFQFHEFLHAEAERLGVTNPPHGIDRNHNHYLGIALAMLDGGQPGKAAVVYNRWAVLARHRPIQLLATDPVRVRFDIGDLVIENGVKRVEQLAKAA